MVDLSSFSVYYDRFSNSRVRVFRRGPVTYTEDGYAGSSGLSDFYMNCFIHYKVPDQYVSTEEGADVSAQSYMTTSQKLQVRTIDANPDFILWDGNYYEVISLLHTNIIFNRYEYLLERITQIPSQIKTYIEASEGAK